MSADVEVAVLGPLEVRVDGALVTVGERTRALIAALALRLGADMPADRLLDLVWPGGPPDGGRNALQALVSRARRALGAGGDRLVTGATGYRLDVATDRTDAGRLEAAVAEARRRDVAAVDVAGLADALRAWRGDPFVEVADDQEAVAAAGRLEELRLEGVELHAEATLRQGGGPELVADLRNLAVQHPTRERLHQALATALYLAGRQTDALAALDDLAEKLRDELGLDPEPRTEHLRTALLRHDLGAFGVPVPGGSDGVGGDAGSPPAGHLDGEVVADGRGATAGSVAVPHGGGGPRPLPHPRTSFVGRDEECRSVSELVATSRLVTLLGPGGTGKTRLAVEVAAALEPPPRDGIAYVDLAPLTDPSDVLPELAASIGLEAQVGTDAASVLASPERPLDERVRQRLRHAEMLLVVDNCEHLIEAAAEAIELALDAGADVCVLATSREGLRVEGERLWPVPPLSIDGSGSGERGLSDLHLDDLPDALLRYDAPRLFVQRATAANPAFVLDPSTAPAVAEVCRRLDGLPLGIELAAARVAMLPVTALAERLEDRFRLLTGGRRTVRRQQTLEAVVAWSYELLDDRQQRVFRQLGVFSGTVALEFAEEVLAGGPDGIPRDDLLPTLSALADRSLVVFGEASERDPEGYGPRISMLETIRAYAHQRLLDEGELAALRGRHAHVLAERAATAAVEIRGHDQLAWFRRLDEEIDEYRAAAAWLLDTEPTVAVRVSADLAWFAWLRDRSDEGARWLERSLAAAGDDVPPGDEAIARGWLAFLLSFSRDQTTGMQQAELAMDALRRAGDTAEDYVDAAVRLLVAYVRAFSVDRAGDVIDELRAAVQLALDLDQRWLVAAGRFCLALVLIGAGDMAAARRQHELGIEAAAVAGDRWAEYQHRVQLASQLSVAGDYAAAISHVDRAIPLAEAIGAYAQARMARVHRAVLAVHTHEYDLAERLVDDVLGRRGMERGDGMATAYAVSTLTILRRRQGRHAEALATARRAEAGFLDIEESGGAIVGAVNVAYAELAAGDVGAARNAVERAVRYATYLPPVVLGSTAAYLLETDAAVVLAENGDKAAEQAALRLGRADRLRELVQGPAVGSERFDIDRTEAAVIDALGREQAAAAMAAGRERTGLLPPLD